MKNEWDEPLCGECKHPIRQHVGSKGPDAICWGAAEVIGGCTCKKGWSARE